MYESIIHRNWIGNQDYIHAYNELIRLSKNNKDKLFIENARRHLARQGPLTILINNHIPDAYEISYMVYDEYTPKTFYRKHTDNFEVYLLRAIGKPTVSYNFYDQETKKLQTIKDVLHIPKGVIHKAGSHRKGRKRLVIALSKI